MQYRVDHSSTSVKLRILLDVLGLTEASAGLIISTIADNEPIATRYRSSSSEIETITTIGTFAAPTAGKCRFKAVDAINHPYLYEIQLANARFAVAGATSMLVTITGAGIRSEGIHIPIDLPQAPHTTAAIAIAASSQIATDVAGLDAGWDSAQESIAAFVEAAILNDGDGQALLAAISAQVQTLFDSGADVPVSTLVSLIAAQITSDHGAGSYVRNTEPDNAGIGVAATAAAAAAASAAAAETEAEAATRQTAVLAAIEEVQTAGVNITQINGIPIELGDLAMPVISSSPVLGGLLTLVPGNGYNLLGENEIGFPTGDWINLDNVDSVALSLVWHTDRSDRTVLINHFTGVVDVAGSRVYFEPDETTTGPLWDYRTTNREDLCYDVDFTMKVAAGGKIQTRIHGQAVILDSVVQP